MEKELLPAEGGGYVAAKNAYWPLHAPLAAVFSNEQLAWLCKTPERNGCSLLATTKRVVPVGGINKYIESLGLNKLDDRSFLQNPPVKGGK